MPTETERVRQRYNKVANRYDRAIAVAEALLQSEPAALDAVGNRQAEHKGQSRVDGDAERSTEQHGKQLCGRVPLQKGGQWRWPSTV